MGGGEMAALNDELPPHRWAPESRGRCSFGGLEISCLGFRGTIGSSFDLLCRAAVFAQSRWT